MAKTKAVNLVGRESLTAAQAAAVVTALKSVLMRDDYRRGDPGYEPTLSPNEWHRANEALAKIQFALELAGGGR